MSRLNITQPQRWIALLVILLLALVQWSGWVRPPWQAVRPWEVVPANTPLAVEWVQPYTWFDSVSRQPAYQAFRHLPALSKTVRDLHLLDTLLHGYTAREALQQSSLVAALLQTQADDFEWLYIWRTSDAADLMRSCYLRATSAEETTFQGVRLYTCRYTDANATITIGRLGHLLLVSVSGMLVEQGIAQAGRYRSTLPQQAEFRSCYRSLSRRAACKVLWQAEQWHNLYALWAPPTESQAVLCQWVGAEFNTTTQPWGLNGTTTPLQLPALQAWAAHARQQSNNLAALLPDHTAWYLWLSASHWPSLSPSAEFEQYIAPWLGSQLVVGLTDPAGSTNLAAHRFVVIPYTDSTKAVNLLAQYAVTYGSTQYDTYLNYQYACIKAGPILAPLLGELSGIQHPYYTLSDGCVIFTNTAAALKTWIDKRNFGQTLLRLPSVSSCWSALSKEGALQTYLNASLLVPAAVSLARPNLADTLLSAAARWTSLYPLLLQASPRAGGLTWQASWGYNSSVAAGNSVLWRTDLDAPARQLWLVRSPDGKHSAIAVQDEQHALYLLDRSGSIQWKRSLQQPIMSEIYELDYYGNGRLQYVFNTQSAVFLLDENGNNLAPPIQLAAPATAGMLFADYGRGPRLWVPCANQVVYGFEKDGRPMSGWNPSGKTGLLHTTPSYLKDPKQGDLIATFANDGQLTIHQINGKVLHRIKWADKFLPSAPLHSDVVSTRWMVGSIQGKVYVANTRGEQFGISVKAGSNQQVQVQVVRPNTDERAGIVALSGRHLSAYYYRDKQLVKTWERTLPTMQQLFFTTGQYSPTIVGTLDTTQGGRVTLLDAITGQVLPNMPVAGSTRCRIADLTGSGKATNMAVANGSSVYAFRIVPSSSGEALR